MKRRVLPPFALIGALLVAAMPARAWDSGGHELVATLAWSRLNPKAQQALSDLAPQMQNPDQTYDPITIACWMDDLRRNSAMPYHGQFLSWHYIDIPIDDRDPMPSFEPGNDNALHGDVVQALKRATVVLRGGSDPYITSKAMACAMVMHLVGDIHQPLHCATKYFFTHGELHDDHGGNKEGVLNGPLGDTRFNLHAFWDSAWRASFDDATGLVVIDPAFDDEIVHNPASVKSLAASLALTPLPSTVSLAPDFDAWARESNAIARDFVYREITATDNRKYCRLSSSYVAKAQTIARGRLVLAAARLAELLNETLGAEHPEPVPPSYPVGAP